MDENQKKKFLEYLAFGSVEDSVDWTIHDKRYHKGLFKPETMVCEARAAYEHGDLADTLTAEEEEALRNCKKKVEETLVGVTRKSVRKDIGKYIFNGLLNGDIKEPDFSKAMSMAYAAAWFFDSYSRKILTLSDGRCVYFAPSPENRKHGKTNSESWAVYCVHAVTHGGEFVKKSNSKDSKPYRERVWSPKKVDNMKLVESILLQERCVPETKDKTPDKDGIRFVGTDNEGQPMRVIARLDEYGNMDADLTEVTSIVTGEDSNIKEKKEPEKILPLKEAVSIVALHEQAHKDKHKE